MKWVPTDKSPGIAALLSFIFAGLGEIYAGKPLRGIGLLVIEIYLWWAIFSDFSAVPFRLNVMALLLSFIVTPASMVNAYFCAKQYNAKNFSTCPRCGGKNPLGAPQCLLCWAPLSSGGAPAYGPRPGPPPPSRP